MIQPWQRAFVVIYSIIMSLVITANFTVLCFIFYRSIQIKKSSKNILVLSVCVADLCVGIFVIPNIIMITASVTDWIPVLCKMCLYTEFMATYASAMTMTFIAIDRFRAIIWPIKFRNTKTISGYLMVVFIWISAVLYSLRALLLYDVIDVEMVQNNSTVIAKKCTVPMAFRHIHNGLVITDFILLFGVPGATLLFTNIVVSVHLRKQNLSNSDHVMRKRRKAIKLLIAMVAIFVVCHLPLFVMRLYMLTHKVKDGMVYIRTFLLMSFTNSFTNVLFYSSFSEDVKKLRNIILQTTWCFGTQKSLASVHPLQTSSNAETSNV